MSRNQTGKRRKRNIGSLFSVHGVFITTVFRDTAEKYAKTGYIVKINDSGKYQMARGQDIPDDLSKSKKHISSQQGWIYESLAIETRPKIYSGGLTRTETCPRKIMPFSGARVGS